MGTDRRVRIRISYRVTGGTLVVDCGTPMRVLSSAPWGGGLQTTRYILNHQVDANPAANGLQTAARQPLIPNGHPSRRLRQVASSLGIDEPCVGLMTAVPMTQLIAGREKSNGLWVECFATVGVTNAVCAGEPHNGSRSVLQKPGTINLILITNGCLSHAAMVGAVQVATESKTGVLRDHAVPSWTGRRGATGTGTDAVVIACAHRHEGRWLPYSGTHTAIGELIGRVVTDCVTRGLARAKEWRARSGRINV
ncbi:adenosylcobinamide amidohydrolase [Nitrospira moscoviensis]|uniref:Putative Adenosylcobinamide amidohydrolase n=1 Tax=Nitrospira moscoviensis TaxID=42253 RepID=A0A0K2GBB9_NITMO|nr:adenosylcobinamide amidohydrolase [Nitrospira moscoviensis]ALA58261.1 putative Adenosylcobinamide amidohydrolase [Nitrospira moscoviensis]